MNALKMRSVLQFRLDNSFAMNARIRNFRCIQTVELGDVELAEVHPLPT